MSAAYVPSVLDRRAPLDHHSQFDFEHQRTIADIHAAWLSHALTTGPSDRSSAEAAVAQLYRLADRPVPEFVWVSSPPAGADLIVADGLASSVPIAHGMRQSAHSDVAAVITRSKRRMAARIDPHRRVRRFGWWQAPVLPPDPNPAPRARARREIRDSLHTSISDGIAAAIRSLTPPIAGYVTWYGQHEVPWIAHCVAGPQLGLARYAPEDVEILDIHCALARATGWWWPFDNVCVMAERPTELHTEPTPDAQFGQRRLHHEAEPAIQFADRKALYVLHGTVVPEWVMHDPTVERIARERNVEVRRCAIERLGWDVYISEAGMTLIDQADDPGNSDGTLSLYATPPTVRRNGRILLVLNGSRERDGTRRRYGLPVPDGMSSALDAAGWTYGISGDDYSRLVRRT
ncbi:DUF6745 domain-containing protein [Williamsia sp. R60]